MPLVGWIGIGVLVIRCVTVVLLIGQPRKPLTPADALYAMFWNAAWIIALLSLGGVL